MLVSGRISARWFRADQEGIDKLKNECFDGAREFSYFRKGGWSGIRASIDNAARWAIVHPRWSQTGRAPYAASDVLLQRIARDAGTTTSVVRRFFASQRSPRTVCRRVVCSPRVEKARIAEWEAICGKGTVAVIPRAQVGPFAYVVSDRMWAVFARFGPDDLGGLVGTDRKTILVLRDGFDHEFVVARIRAEERT